jgi:hypothetical protein
MTTIMDHPIVVFAATFLALIAASSIGEAFRKKRNDMGEEERNDFSVILTATLTLLGLIIGFTFSMAISRYDQRKNYEEEEANAIGTEYLRADLLPQADGDNIRRLLKTYLAERINFYETTGEDATAPLNARTTDLQSQLWNAVKTPAPGGQPTIQALTITGMNDVLNWQGYTQAAWWNRIPLAAWALMLAIAICCNVMIGYYLKPGPKHWLRTLALPLIAAVSFMLIADIDSPQGGIIRVKPQNLLHLQNSMK